MSEQWKPNLDDENEPRAVLHIPDGERELNRGNARLYTHMGHLAIYDHVFVSGDEELLGFYVFNFVGGFDELKDFMLRNEYPSYLNMTEVSQGDIDAYDRVIQASMGDIDAIPDDWV